MRDLFSQRLAWTREVRGARRRDRVPAGNVFGEGIEDTILNGSHLNEALLFI
jgi:hypothetical protein